MALSHANTLQFHPYSTVVKAYFFLSHLLNLPYKIISQIVKT